MTASTPHAGHLLGVAAGADGGHDHHPGVLQLPDQRLLGRQGERRHPHLFPDQQLDPVADVGLVGAQVDAERLRRCASLTSAMTAAELGERHGGGGQDAEPAGLGRGRHQPRPGHPAHAGLHDRVVDADQVAQPGVQRRVVRHALDLAGCGPRRGRARCAARPAPRRSAAGSRAPRRGRPARSPVAATTSSTVTPGWTDRSRMRWSGVSKSSTPRLVTTRRISWWAATNPPTAGGPAVADPDTMSTSSRTPAASGWAPSSWSGG